MRFDDTSQQWVDESGRPVAPPVGAVPGSIPGAAAAPQMAAPQAQRGGGGQLTPQERATLYQHMPAISQQETELARAQALSDELRGQVEPNNERRMDWASQGARALSGIGAAMKENQMKKDRPGLIDKYRRMGQSFGGMDYADIGDPGNDMMYRN